jgi:hypothetical protein
MYIAKIKTKAVLRFRQLLICTGSQSAPSSAKKGSFKKLFLFFVPYRIMVVLTTMLVVATITTSIQDVRNISVMRAGRYAGRYGVKKNICEKLLFY